MIVQSARLFFLLSCFLQVCLYVHEFRIREVHVPSIAHSGLLLHIVSISLYELLILVLVECKLLVFVCYSNLLCLYQSSCLFLSQLRAGPLVTGTSFAYIFHVLPFKLIFLHLKLGYLWLKRLANRVLVYEGSLLWLVLCDWEVIDCFELRSIVRHEFNLSSWYDLLLRICFTCDCMAQGFLWAGWIGMLSTVLIFHDLAQLRSLVE